MSQNRQSSGEVPRYSLPTKIPPPLFDLGTAVRWNSVTGDRGLVLGLRYIWNKHIQDWEYQYYVALDLNSPSYQWTKFDWGWEEDLTEIPTSDSLLNNEDRNE